MKIKLLSINPSIEVAPAPEEDKNILELKRKMETMETQLDEMKLRIKNSHTNGDPKAGLFFDAIFNDLEAGEKIS